MIVSEGVDYSFLSIFADGKPHNYHEIIYLGTIYLNTKQSYTEKLLQRAVVGHNWVCRVGIGPSLAQDQLILTNKGDAYYRFMAIRRNPEEYRLYKHFNRGMTSDGFSSYGLDKIAPTSEGITYPGGPSRGLFRPR